MGNYWKAVGTAAAAAVVAVAFFVWWPRGDEPAVYVPRGDEGPLLTFVVERLMAPFGGIYTNLRDDLPESNDNLAVNHHMLSESVGLMMEYALRSDRADLFESQVRFLEHHLLTKDGRIRWVVDPDREWTVYANASIDDLKIIDALYTASDRWRARRFEELADRLAAPLLAYADGGYLPDYYEWEFGTASDYITSSYLDLESLRALSIRNPAWISLYETADRLLQEAALPNGFYYKTYDLNRRTWLVPDSFNMIDVLYAAVHAAEGGRSAEPTIAFIERKWREDGRIFNAYDIAGSPTDDNVSPAVYALAYRLLHGWGPASGTAESIYEALFGMTVRDRRSPYYGGFVDIPTLEGYSFDHLQALLAEEERKNNRGTRNAT